MPFISLFFNYVTIEFYEISWAKKKQFDRWTANDFSSHVSIEFWLNHFYVFSKGKKAGEELKREQRMWRLKFYCNIRKRFLSVLWYEIFFFTEWICQIFKYNKKGFKLI